MVEKGVHIENCTSILWKHTNLNILINFPHSRHNVDGSSPFQTVLIRVIKYLKFIHWCTRHYDLLHVSNLEILTISCHYQIFINLLLVAFSKLSVSFSFFFWMGYMQVNECTQFNFPNNLLFCGKQLLINRYTNQVLRNYCKVWF